MPPWEKYGSPATPDIADAPTGPWNRYGGAPVEAAPVEEKPDQTSLLDRLGFGFKAPARKGAQLLARGVEAVAPIFGEDAAQTAAAHRQRVDDSVARQQQEYDAKRGSSAGKFDPAYSIGNAVQTLPFALMMPGAGATSLPGLAAAGAGQGAVTSALTPITQDQDKFWRQTGKETAVGAGMGSLTNLGIGALSRVISPKVAPEVAAMRDANVDLPAGRAMGGIAKSAEGALRDIPIGGGFARAADTRALGQYNVASVNKALEPLGVTFDTRTTAAGNDLIKQAGSAVENAYANAASKISGTVDDAFKTDLSIVPRLTAKLSPDLQSQVSATLRQELPIVEGAALDGAKLIEIKKTFRDLAYEAKKSGAPDTLSEIYKTVSKSVDGLIGRISPEGHQLAQAADAAYRNMRTVGKASTKALSDGVFTPTQLAQASRTVGGQSATASGSAPMQPFAQAGMKALDGAGAATPRGDILGLIGSPISGSIGLGTALPLYSAPAQQAWMTALTRRPSQAQAFADALRNLNPYMAGSAGTQAPPYRPGRPQQTPMLPPFGNTI